MAKVVQLCLITILQLLLEKSYVTGQEIPDLPDYFSAYIESQSTLKNFGTSTYNITKDYFDETVQLSRNDISADSLYPDAPGLLSIITDPTHKVQYYIQRETRNCTVSPLTVPVGGGGIVMDPDGTYHFGAINSLFYLVNTSLYEYVGNNSAHGVILDNWTYTGDFDLPNISYSDATIDLSIARNGISTQGHNLGPVPWRIAVRGNISVYDGLFTDTITSVSRLFDLSFVEPDFDVFDVSVCSEPKDNLILSMAIPKDSNKVDYSTFRKKVRQAIVGFTQVLPIQVGAIEIIKDNGTALFATAQISNLTTLANVPDAVTALAAMTKITEDTVDGALPFQIEITSGVMVTPHLVLVSVVEPTSPVSTTSEMPIPTSSSEAMPTSSSEAMPTSSTASSSTTTVTVTVTPSSCPTMPDSSMYVCPTSTPSPAPLGKTYSQSYVVGLAFGMIILGAAVAILSLFVGIFFFAKCKKVSMRTGYERHINPTS